MIRESPDHGWTFRLIVAMLLGVECIVYQQSNQLVILFVARCVSFVYESRIHQSLEWRTWVNLAAITSVHQVTVRY